MIAKENAIAGGKTVLVTGAARRIGAAIATHLHGEGMNVALHYRRSAAEANALCQALNASRPNSAILIRADLRDPAGVDSLIETTLEWGRLDALINNASSFYPTPLGQVSEADWNDLIDSNLKAPFFLSQAAAPALRSSRGAIVNMIDIHALRPLCGYAVYCIAKAGLATLTRALARELGPEVRVNGIAPGAILWPETGLNEQQKRAVISRTALKRMGNPADVAAAVLYLVRDAAYVTGQILTVDGGRSIDF